MPPSKLNALQQLGLSQRSRLTPPPSISWLMGLTLQHPNLISLAAGFTDNPSLPTQQTLQLVQTVLATKARGQKALQYGSTEGDSNLRKETVKLVESQDASTLPGPENWIITNGSQQFLYLITEALCDPGDIVLVEDPTYFVYLSILQSHGVESRTIPIHEDGLDLAHLQTQLDRLLEEGKLSKVKFLYLVTYYQNPTSFTTSLEKKKQALALLKHYEKKAGHAIYLLEDAAYRDLKFCGTPPPSALSLPEFRDRVIYTSTYSKPFATGIRLGYGTAPKPIREAMQNLKGNHDFGSPNFTQQILCEALLSGIYQDHLKALQSRYQKKSNTMLRAIRTFFPKQVEYWEPSGGLYVWARLPKKCRTGKNSAFFKKALESEVLYVPGELCYAPDPTRRTPNQEMRLSFGGATQAQIQEGIQRLGQVLKEFLA